MEVSALDEKKVHLVLDNIVVRLNGDAVAAEKKHTDAVKAFEEAADEQKKAKTVLDAEQLTFNGASLAFGMARSAFNNSTKKFAKESKEAAAAQVLTLDESWKKEVEDLKGTIEAVETLRVEVEKLNDEYVHTTAPTASTTPAATTTTAPTASTTPAATTTAGTCTGI